MPNKIRKIIKYLLYILWSNVIYGFIVYYVFTWLGGYSLLCAYLGNLALIIAGLAMDEYLHKFLQSKKLIAELKEEKDSKKNFSFVQWIMNSFVSFKTILYLFYVFILIFSQVIIFHPVSVGDNIKNFISANEYTILFLIALDTLIRQFSSDRKRMKKIAEKLEKSLTENQN